MKLLSPSRPIGAHDKNDAEDSSSDGSSLPTTPVDAAFPNFNHTTGLPRTVVVIDILPEPSSSRRVSHGQNPSTEPAGQLADEIIRPDPHPRPFRSIDPTVTFIGPSQLSAQSSCVVRIRGVSVSSETTRLTSIGPAPGRNDGALLYSAKLVPGFWDRISASSGRSRLLHLSLSTLPDLESHLQTQLNTPSNKTSSNTPHRPPRCFPPYISSAFPLLLRRSRLITHYPSMITAMRYSPSSTSRPLPPSILSCPWTCRWTSRPSM